MSDSTNKRPDAPAAGESSTPAKRARLDKPTTTAAASSAAATGSGETPSSPYNAKDTDSPSTRGGGKKNKRGGGGGGRGGRGGRGGGRGGRNEEKDTRSWGGRNTGKGEKEMRPWGKQSRNDEEAAKAAAVGSAEGMPAASGGEGEDKAEKLPKKKVAVLIGYNGIGYKGSQHNPGQPTIEGEFFKAFVEAGVISADNSVNPHKVSLARAARTDAGVHAAINVISLKMILQPPSMVEGTTLEEHLNSFLPSTMRVWSVIRVQGAFDPRRLCDQRQYEYTLPTHVFLGPKPGSPMAETLEKLRAASRSSSSVPPATSASTDASAAPTSVAPAIAATKAFWEAQDTSKFGADVEAKKKWRMPQDLLEEARKFVHEYEGSHNYYNFTVQKDFRDRSCQRVMKKLEISEPFVVNDVEYVSVRFLGQSFMLHQIRKMIGLFILSVRAAVPASLVPETFGPSRIHVPKAPGLGLLLIEPQYIEYNKRVGEANTKNVGLAAAGKLNEQEMADSTRETIDPERIGLNEKLDAFKAEQVYKRMWQVEEESLVFSKWLNYLDTYVGNDFDYLNPKGVIPAAATFKKGEDTEKNRVAAKAAAETAKAETVKKEAVTETETEVALLSDDEGVAGEEEG